MVNHKDEDSDSVNQKRTFVRYPADLQFEFEFDGISYKEGNSIINLCIGGIAFTTNKELKLEDVIRLRIPDKNPCFEGDGKVVWIVRNENTYKVGIEFVSASMTGAYIDGLHKLLADVSGDEHDQEKNGMYFEGI